jgi:hypothetical protein
LELLDLEPIGSDAKLATKGLLQYNGIDLCNWRKHDMDSDEIKKLIRSSQVFKFNSLALAHEFIYRAFEPLFILHGDDKFWVTTGRIAGLLESAGYEIVA